MHFFKTVIDGKLLDSSKLFYTSMRPIIQIQTESNEFVPECF